VVARGYIPVPPPASPGPYAPPPPLLRYFTALAGETSAWGKATGNIDAPAAIVLAYLWHLTGYGRQAKRDSRYFILEVEVPNSHSMIQYIETNIGAGQNRVWAAKWTWFREAASNDFVAVMTTVQDLPEGEEKANILATIEQNKSSQKTILAEFKGCYRIHAIAKNACRLELAAQGTLGGWIPDMAMKFMIKFTLSVVEGIRDTYGRHLLLGLDHPLAYPRTRSPRYERNEKEVDAQLRAAFAQPPTLILEDQEHVVARSMELEASSATSGLPWVAFKSPPLVELWTQHAPAGYGERSIATGKAQCVLDAPALQAAAWYFAPYVRAKRARRRARKSAAEAGCVGG
jgi:hypothetical protein